MGEVRAERLLFRTDTPFCFAASQRARIDQAELSHADRCRIRRDNTLTLFDLVAEEPA